MRSLYWKIFLSFWLATILIIVTTAWITGQIVRSSSIPVRERVFMDSYANAAVATFEAGKRKALAQWLDKTGMARHMKLFLISSNGIIIGKGKVPASVKEISQNLLLDQLDQGIVKTGNLIVSHEILSTSGLAYRLVAISDQPLSHFIEIPWGGLVLRLSIAVFFSGLICYLLSLYLTQPLRSLKHAAKSLATGQLSTRVGKQIGHQHDEIAELRDEFDSMAEKLETLVNSKERLLQDISHELRSPLARLSIALELARKKTGQLVLSEFERMETDIYRLNALIGEILEFARLDKSTTRLDLQAVHLPSLLNDIIKDANFEFCKEENCVSADQLENIELKLDERLIRRAIENIQQEV